VPDPVAVGGGNDAAPGVGDFDRIDGGVGEDGRSVPAGGLGNLGDGLLVTKGRAAS